MSLKRAVLIGIDDYKHFNGLDGCVNDVKALAPLLQRHDDGSPNFTCLTCTSDGRVVDRRTMLAAFEQLLAPGADVGLLYFAGHGASVDNDVVLVAQDGMNGDEGVPLSAILAKVQASKLDEVIIILDCCYAGAAGGAPQLGGNVALLRSGLSILTASRGDQTAAETSDGRGQFSLYLCGSLEGGAADVMGKVTLAGIYAYLTESFGAFDQRPTFKAHVDRLNTLRNCKAAIAPEILRRLPEYFPNANEVYALDPSYEWTAKEHDPDHSKIFGQLQRCVSAKLVEPVGAEHMYYAAMHSKGCQLTPLGKHYRRLAEQGGI
jgi:Caspase domain